jgi:TPR repeat protein
MYKEGRGVPQNYAEAYRWLSLAAAQGYADAVEDRDNILALMTPAQIAKGQQLVAEWRPR